MEKISDKKIDSLFSKWFSQNPSFDMPKLPVTPQVRAFFNETWPATIPLNSPVTAVYLLQILTLQYLNTRPRWIVCDGAVPLLWFFKNNPNPENVNSILYIHEEIYSLVPKAWRKNTKPFRMVSVRPRFEPIKKIDTVILTGLMTDAYCSLDNLKLIVTQVGAVLKHYGTKKVQFKSFLPAKYFYHSMELAQTYPLNYVQCLARTIGTEIEPITYTKFLTFDRFSSALVFDLNDYSLVSNSFLMNYALSKGAVSGHEHRSSPTVPRDFISVSPYHGVLFNENVKNDNAIELDLYTAVESYHEKVFKVMGTSANLSLPWPQWFSEWVRTL